MISSQRRAGASGLLQIEAHAEAGEAWSPDADDLALVDALFPPPQDPGARV